MSLLIPNFGFGTQAFFSLSFSSSSYYYLSCSIFWSRSSLCRPSSTFYGIFLDWASKFETKKFYKFRVKIYNLFPGSLPLSLSLRDPYSLLLYSSFFTYWLSPMWTSSTDWRISTELSL